MNALLLAGTVAMLVAVVLGVYPILNREVSRRERLVISEFNRLGAKRGLRGKFNFAFKRWSSHGSIASSSYKSADEIDRAIHSRIGSAIQNEAMELSARMYWTERRIGVVVILVAILGTALIILSLIV